MSDGLFLNQPSIWMTVASHLPPIAYMCLVRASPQFWRMSRRCNLSPKLHFETALAKALQTYCGDQADKVQANLNIAYLTGSFLLAVLNGDNVVQTCNDIDLVALNISESSLNLRDYGLPLLQFAPSDDESRWTKENGYDESIVKCCRNLPLKNGRVIQRIVANSACIQDYLDTFDFDFCANSWDGQRLVMRNVNAVISRRTHLDIRKAYFDRLPADINADTCTSIILPKKLARIKKYKQRGYSITTRKESTNVRGLKRRKLEGRRLTPREIYTRVDDFEDRWNYFWSIHIRGEEII